MQVVTTSSLRFSNSFLLLITSSITRTKKKCLATSIHNGSINNPGLKKLYQQPRDLNNVLSQNDAELIRQIIRSKVKEINIKLVTLNYPPCHMKKASGKK